MDGKRVRIRHRVREMMIEYDEDDGMIERDYRDWEKEI
jgi:hypothetical protein